MISNAIRHGNRYDFDKKVIVLYKVTMEGFSISVIDEGDGFDHKNLPNPLTEENLIKDHGRGLFLVKNYLDEVTFNKKGNRIKATKYLK
jgi:serine/threonine-protein kinase RsbW